MGSCSSAVKPTTIRSNKLAGTTGLAATGACNIYAGLPISKWQDLQGACNAIAGTVGLGPAEALRRVNM